MTAICWTGLFVILEVSRLFVAFILLLMGKHLLHVANNVGPDQMPHSMYAFKDGRNKGK